MFTHPLRLAGAVAFAFFSSHSVAVDTLQPVTISASRSSTLVDQLPVAAQVLDREALAQSTATNLAELLGEVPGIHALAINSTGSAGTTIDMLGFGITGGQNTLILLDGQRITPPDLSSVDFSAIPLNAIERIEILPATGAVLYGLGASAGAINIVTRNSFESGGSLEIGGGSFRTRRGKVDGAVSDEQLAAFGAVSREISDGYRDHNKAQLNNAFGHLRYRNEHMTASLATLAKSQSLSLPGPLAFSATDTRLRDDPTAASTPNDWSDDDNITLLPSLVVQLGDTARVILDGSASEREQAFFYDDYSGFGFTTYTETTTNLYSVTPRIEWRLDTAGLSHQLIAGVDFRRSDYESDIALNEQVFDRPIHRIDAQQRERSAYLLDVISLGDALSATLGVRQSRVKTRGEDHYDPNAPAPAFSTDAEAPPLSQREESDQWQIGLRYQARDNFAVFANAERNARIANVNEIFEQKFDPNTFTAFREFDALDTQTGRLYSAGASWQEGRQSSSLMLWQGDYDDEIQYDPIAFENVNAAPTRRRGASLNSRQQLDERTWLTFGGTIQRAHFRHGPLARNNVPLVPEQMLYLRLDWQASDWLALSLAHSYIGRKHLDNDQTDDFPWKIPSYRHTDLVARVSWRTLYGSVGVYNLEDNRIFDYGTRSTTANRYNGYPLPDRHVMATLGVRF